MTNAVWITWEDQRRNKTLSKALGVKLYQVEANYHRLIRYPVLIVRTLYILLSSKPKIIFAQNPSIILALFIAIYGAIFNKKVVIDAHNAGVFPFEGKFAWANFVTKIIFKSADLIIVTNESLKSYVELNKGNAFVLPDPFPVIESSSTKNLKGKVNYLLICTWASDEPYMEAIQAFSNLDDSYVLYVTGNSKGKEKKLPFEISDNIQITGYLSNQDFDLLLSSCDVIIDLTTREDCLVCGAYEAISAGTPLILSDTKALRHYFKESAIYTQNTVDSIQSNVLSAATKLPELKQQVIIYREQQQQLWNDMKLELLAYLNMPNN